MKPDIENAIDFAVIGIDFRHKPIVVGGLAMEFHGLRPRGEDIDFIIHDDDYQQLRRLHPDCRKDIWGDLGIHHAGYELFRSMWKFDYAHFLPGSIELARVRVVNIDQLFRMKVFALQAHEKHQADVELIKRHFEVGQNPAYRRYMEAHVPAYLEAPGGTLFNNAFEEHWDAQSR